MKTSAITTILLAALGSAHYTFDQLVVNDQLVGRANTFIRRHQNGFMPIKFKSPPESSITPLDADFSCNKGAVGAAEVITVKPGDKVALKQAFGGTGMLHPGPSQLYVSPVSNAKADGGADWFKIHQSILCTKGAAETLRNDAWCSFGEDRVFTAIPDTLPNGQYLLRGEHIGLHGAHVGEAEFYVACVQIEVTGSAATSIPGTSTKIPGVYKAGDAAVNFSVWGRSTSYPVTPGPDVIPGGFIRGSADGADGDKTVTVGASDAATVNTGKSSSESNANTNTGSKQTQPTTATPKATKLCNKRRRRSVHRHFRAAI